MKVKAKAEAASSTIRIKTGILKGLVLGAGNPMDLIPRLETGRTSDSWKDRSSLKVGQAREKDSKGRDNRCYSIKSRLARGEA